MNNQTFLIYIMTKVSREKSCSFLYSFEREPEANLEPIA